MLTRRQFLALPALLIPAGIAKADRSLLSSSRDADILTRTIYGEAVGESERGQIAVAHVIFNRVRSDNPAFKHDRTVSAACLRPGQFSCWRNANHLHKLDINKAPAADIRNLLWLANHRYMMGDDYSNGATFFVRTGTPAPLETKTVARIGNHTFMKLRSK